MTLSCRRIVFSALLLLLLLAPMLSADPAPNARAKAEAQVKLATKLLEGNYSDVPAATAAFQKAVELDPTYPLPRFYLGTLARKQAKWAEAIEHFEAFSKLDAASDYFVQAQLQIAECRKAIEREKSHPPTATPADPVKFTAQFDLANKAEADGLRGKAAHAYAQAYGFAPARVDVGLKAARLLVEIEEPLQAAAVLRPLLKELAPRSGADDKALAVEAAELFKKVASAIDAEHARLIGLAVKSGTADRADEALAAMKQARELLPDQQMDDLLAASLQLKAGRTDGALAEVKRAMTHGKLEPALVGAGLATVAGQKAAGEALAGRELSEFLTDAFGAKGLEKAVAGTANRLPLAGGGATGESLKNSIGMSLVRIAPGSFMMGSAADEIGRFDNETQHEVTLTKGFYLGATAVTQAQWKAVMGTDPSHFKGDDLPVEMVSWDEAMAFCQRLSGKVGKHYRLPTEAEREYACRAGTNGRFGGTGDLDEMAWFGDNSGRDRIDSDNIWKTDQPNYGKRLLDNGCQTHPVARKKANAWGLYDMHGNVWEWCSDWYGDYPNAAVTDPQGSANGSSRVLRGGSWGIIPRICRSANRGRYAPGYRSNYIGFRVCLDFE